MFGSVELRGGGEGAFPTPYTSCPVSIIISNIFHLPRYSLFKFSFKEKIVNRWFESFLFILFKNHLSSSSKESITEIKCDLFNFFNKLRATSSSSDCFEYRVGADLNLSSNEHFLYKQKSEGEWCWYYFVNADFGSCWQPWIGSVKRSKICIYDEGNLIPSLAIIEMKDWWRRTFTYVTSILTGSFSLQISMCSLRISALSNGFKHIIKKISFFVVWNLWWE